MFNSQFNGEHSAHSQSHNARPAAGTPTPGGFGQSVAAWGLHPAVAGSVFCADQMLFAGEVFSFGATVILSVLVGVALIVPCALVQRYCYGDSWGAAIGKAGLVSLLTAIPTSLPSALTAAWGLAGYLGMKYRASHPTTIGGQN